MVIGFLMRTKDSPQFYISYCACIDWIVTERHILFFPCNAYLYYFSLQYLFKYTSAWPRTPIKPCLLACINVNSDFKHHKLILFHRDFSWEHMFMGQIPK